MLYKRYLNYIRKGIDNWFDNLFIVKNDVEIDKLRKAAEISSNFFLDIIETIKVGMTERQVADFIVEKIKKEKLKSSFKPIVASGWRSAFFHGPTSDKKFEKGDFIIIDYGIIYRGYHGDITRTIVLSEPTEKHKQIYNLVKEGQKLAVEQLKPNASCFDIDKSVREHFAKHNMEGYFIHGLGHGLGLGVHEKPLLNNESKDILKENVVVTIEPGIYIPGFGGVRIEDDILITNNGYEYLTNAKRDLISI